MRLTKDLVALVTGGNSGLGQATVQMLSRYCNVAIAARSVADDAAPVRAQDGEGSIVHVKGDCSKIDDAKSIVEKTVKHFGRVDILLNCAGIGIKQPLLSKDHVINDLEMTTKVININVLGSMYMSAFAAQQMAKQQPHGDREERGVIINLSSLTYQVGNPGVFAYSASKGAIVSMTMPMAKDLIPHRIRVNTIVPGFFETAMTTKYGEALHWDELSPFSKAGKPEDFAKMVQHIVENGSMNGCIV